MEDSKPVCTLMVTGCSLSSNDESAIVHQPTYRSMIGSLLYLIGTRPDIIHAMGIVGRFQENPKESHLQQSKGSSNIFKEHRTLVYGILEIHILHFMHIQMQIGQEVLMIEKALVLVHSIWVLG